MSQFLKDAYVILKDSKKGLVTNVEDNVITFKKTDGGIVFTTSDNLSLIILELDKGLDLFNMIVDASGSLELFETKDAAINYLKEECKIEATDKNVLSKLKIAKEKLDLDEEDVLIDSYSNFYDQNKVAGYVALKEPWNILNVSDEIRILIKGKEDGK